MDIWKSIQASSQILVAILATGGLFCNAAHAQPISFSESWYLEAYVAAGETESPTPYPTAYVAETDAQTVDCAALEAQASALHSQCNDFTDSWVDMWASLVVSCESYYDFRPCGIHFDPNCNPIDLFPTGERPSIEDSQEQLQKAMCDGMFDTLRETSRQGWGVTMEMRDLWDQYSPACTQGSSPEIGGVDIYDPCELRTPDPVTPPPTPSPTPAPSPTPSPTPSPAPPASPEPTASYSPPSDSSSSSSYSSSSSSYGSASSSSSSYSSSASAQGDSSRLSY